MLRFIVYLLSIGRLLLVGKWYPPAYVRDVSQADFSALVALVKEKSEMLELVARQTEATRKKVYREDVKAGAQEEAVSAAVFKENSPPSADALSQMVAGDEVPAGLL